MYKTIENVGSINNIHIKLYKNVLSIQYPIYICICVIIDTPKWNAEMNECLNRCLNSFLTVSKCLQHFKLLEKSFDLRLATSLTFPSPSKCLWIRVSSLLSLEFCKILSKNVRRWSFAGFFFFFRKSKTSVAFTPIKLYMVYSIVYRLVCWIVERRRSILFKYNFVYFVMFYLCFCCLCLCVYVFVNVKIREYVLVWRNVWSQHNLRLST